MPAIRAITVFCLVCPFAWTAASAVEPESDQKKAAEPAAPTLADGMSRLRAVVKSSLKERQTLVVWHIDRSQSLNHRRQKLADQIGKLHEDLTADLGVEKLQSLQAAVVSFGAESEIVTPEPVQSLTEVGALIRDLKPDESGKEKTFSAVASAAKEFRRFCSPTNRHNVLFVIFTDERGDDSPRVADVIKQCSQYGIRVFCMGSIAPFGRKTGLVRYTYSDGFEQEIPVDQGPESMRIDVLSTAWINDNRISSGFGPFALAWLCRRTGGEFLAIDDAALHRFDPKVMEQYTPLGIAAESLREIEAEVKANDTKLAVLIAAELARRSGILTPPTQIRADTASAFRTSAAQAQKRAAVVEYRADEMLAALTKRTVDRSTLDTPRWQAAFDLALGRALAMKARGRIFNYRIAQMKVNVQPLTAEDSNTWELVPDDESIESSVIQKLIARATESLQRVANEHQGTPFAYVAELELKHGFGWRWKESVVDWPEVKPRKRTPILPDL